MSIIPNFRASHFKRSASPVHKTSRHAEDRVCAYIAFPGHTSITDVEDVLWWGKAHWGPEAWDQGGEIYLVYQVYVKSHYLFHITSELGELGGFYLCKVEE